MFKPQELVEADRKITITDAQLKGVAEAMDALDVLRRKHFDKGNTADTMVYNVLTAAKQELKLLLQQVEEVKQ